jgi:hypothetical protein
MGVCLVWLWLEERSAKVIPSFSIISLMPLSHDPREDHWRPSTPSQSQQRRGQQRGGRRLVSIISLHLIVSNQSLVWYYVATTTKEKYMISLLSPKSNDYHYRTYTYLRVFLVLGREPSKSFAYNPICKNKCGIVLCIVISL